MTRRELGLALTAAAAQAQEAARPMERDELGIQRERIKRNSETLSKASIGMEEEPHFRFEVL